MINWPISFGCLNFPYSVGEYSDNLPVDDYHPSALNVNDKSKVFLLGTIIYIKNVDGLHYFTIQVCALARPPTVKSLTLSSCLKFGTYCEE